MRSFAVVAGTVLLLGCSAERVQVDAKTLRFLSLFDCPTASGTYESTTISEIITRPAAWDGKPVKVSGYFVSSFEHSAIYPTKQDPFSAIFSGGLWTLLSVDREIVSGQRVTLRGIYTTRVQGHGSQWPGSICVHTADAEAES